MAEKSPIDPAAFTEDFRRMFAVATSGGIAWYNNATWQGPRAPYHIWEEVNPDPHGPGAGHAYENADYIAWPLAAPNGRQPVAQVRDRGGAPTIKSDRDKAGPKGKAIHLTPFQAIIAFGRYAPDTDTLVTVSNTLVEYVNEADNPDTNRIFKCIGYILGRSLLLGPGSGIYNTSDGPPGPFPASLAALEPGRVFDLAKGYVLKHLSDVLRPKIGSPSDIGPIRDAAKKADPSFVVRAAADMERVGFIQPDFWWKKGVEDQLIFTSSAGLELLRRLDTAFATDDEAVLSGIVPSDLQPIMRGYIDQVFTSYTKDDYRDGEMLHKIVEHLATKQSKKMGGGIEDYTADMKVLIALSNGFAISINRRLNQVGITDPDMQLPRLDETRLWNVPPALLRILYATVRPGTNPDIMADMFERDSLHVSVLEALRKHLRRRFTGYEPTRPSSGDTRLRYPAVTPEELPDIITKLGNPATNPATRFALRGRQIAARGLRGYGILGPGGAAS